MGAQNFKELMLPEHTRSVNLFCQINTAALAGIMIVLVLTMLFATWLMSTHRGVGADLPKVLHPIPMPRSLREDAMIVTVMRDGSVFFGVGRVGPHQLRSKILDRLKDRGVERRVYIRADGRVCYRTVKEVLDDVHSAGIERVAFLVDQRRLPATMLVPAVPLPALLVPRPILNPNRRPQETESLPDLILQKPLV